MYPEEQFYSIALKQCRNIGDINFSKLIRHFGTAKNAWEFAKSDFKNKDGISQSIILEIGNAEHLQFAENELKFCEDQKIKILLKHQNEFPYLLKECDDSPSILYVKGNLKSNSKNISIVGTRNITPYGKKFIAEFFEETQKFNFSSVSGLALGVDKEVHEQSLLYKIPTIAVLAHGFKTLYPSKNKSLAQEILQNEGALITEFTSSRKPDRENFLLRNRIVAGLSFATIVVESAFGGGSMNTANYANIYNREVFSLPGRISDKYSQGCNQLIFQNKSSAISTVKNLIESLGFYDTNGKTLELFPPSEIMVELSMDQQLIYQKIAENPHISLDDLSSLASISSHKILPILLQLEILGKIKSFSGRQFTIN